MYQKDIPERIMIRRRRLYNIVECLKEKMTKQQIADELGVSVRTVERDIKFILDGQED